ncbi:sigma-70 family RNA polymerase sigma factor [Alteromonas aestuariivivens]|uniref:Sigma-70 family RNA polymerase sigma factor n=1 Tax=Alteromonas aestuariivivens TaxID=1938339 RepID=A0A3D8M3H0_9ALTE|nr:sigma-70 family RNA polymerase sigma factor [Alteromonas aestuariivivens]RDV24105.1 sigma-70 family RNA polymerase sigma factor [Alteromonas aestuariivivens]
MTARSCTDNSIDTVSLVERIKQGQKSAEQELVERYCRTLRFVIYKRCNSADLADDLTQDALLLTIQKARQGEIRKPEALASFIRQVGVNIVIEYQRKQIRQATHCSDSTDLFSNNPESGQLNLLHRQEALTAVTRLMNELGVERDKVLLWDFFVYEKPKSQICLEQELAPEHFDRILYRARVRLKKLLDERGKSLTDTLNCNLVVALWVSTHFLLSAPVIESQIVKSEVRETSCLHHYGFESVEIDSKRGMSECFTEEEN